MASEVNNVASEVTGAPWIWYFVSDSLKKSASSRIGLWQKLRKYGCPTMVEALHTGIMENDSVAGEVSESLSVTNGVKQVCVLVPTFSIFLSAMLDEVSETWEMSSTYSPDRALTYSTSHTSERRPILLGYWWESWYSQMTVHWFIMCWRDTENSVCFLWCVKEVWPED